MIGKFVQTKRRQQALADMNPDVFEDSSHRTALIEERLKAPLSQFSRPELPDQGDEDSLRFAERAVIGSLMERGMDAVTARAVVVTLTGDWTRTNVQTLLDLTPSRAKAH